MGKIAGWDEVEVGASSPLKRPKGSAVSVARLIEIVEELKLLISGLDPETLSQYNALIAMVTSHINNADVHVTTQIKANITTLLLAYENGTLGGGSGGASVYADRTTLLATQGAVGSIGVIVTEPMNLYIWNPTANRWSVKDGNVYEDIDDLPSDTSFYIPSGTELILSSTGERFTWCVNLPESIIDSDPELTVPPTIIALAINSTGDQLTVTTDIPSFNGLGYTDDNFTLSGPLSGLDIGVTYVSGSGTVTRVYSINSTIYQGDTITLDYYSGVNSIVSSDGAEMESITMVVTTNESTEELIEPYYSELNWLCQDTVLPVVCSEDIYYNGTMPPRVTGENTPQVYENSELYGHIDYGFQTREHAAMNWPWSLKIPKVLPTGDTMSNFEMEAGFYLYQQISNTLPWVLFSVRDSLNVLQFRHVWGSGDIVRLALNGIELTPTFIIANIDDVGDISNDIRLLANSDWERDYLKMTVNGTTVTVTYTKRIREDVYGTGRETFTFDDVVATWTLPSAITFTNPVVYFGGDEFVTPPAYHNTYFGACRLKFN